MGSLTDCTPNSEKKVEKPKKNVKFKNNPTIIVDSPVADPDEHLIFNMIEKDFKANIAQRSELYQESSTERKFIRAIADVIQSNYGMYEQLYRYMNGLVSFDTELSQVGPCDCIFPDQKTFDKLVKDKDSFKKKLILLLNWLEPSYKMNEHFLQMVNSMDADTEIDWNFYNGMVDESIKVKEINDAFVAVFQNFPMESYRKNLNLIRKTTGYIEEKILVKRVPKVNKICPNMGKTVITMKKTLKTAMTIEFKELYAATKKLHGIVIAALKVDDGA